MCFVLDINTFHCLFNSSAQDRVEFLPVYNWLFNFRGTKLVIGGNTYRAELNQMVKYFGILLELKRLGKLAEIDDTVVDSEESRIRNAVPSVDFDDPHIVAIICASGCRIFVSRDIRADRFIKMQCLYMGNQKRPSIYRNRAHVRLLCNKNIVPLRNQKNICR